MLPKPDIRPSIEGVTVVVPELAVEIGLNESLILMQLRYWIKTYNHFKDGQWWAFKSIREMHAEKFPYMSPSTINRTIQNLEDAGLIVTTKEYNEKRYDKTRWFALNVSGLAKLRSITIVTQDGKAYPVSEWETLCQNDTRSTQNETRSNQNDTRSTQNETTIPKNPTKTPTENPAVEKKKIFPAGAGVSIFNQLMQAYIGACVVSVFIQLMEAVVFERTAFKESSLRLLNQRFRAALLKYLAALQPANEPPPVKMAQSGKNPLQEAIAHTFKVQPGGFAGILGAQLTGTATKGERAEWKINDPPMQPVEIVAFGIWYKATPKYEDKVTPPTTASTLYERVLEFRSARNYNTAMAKGEVEYKRLMGIVDEPKSEEEYIPVEEFDAIYAELHGT